MSVMAKKAAAGVPGSSSTALVADTATETTTMELDGKPKGGDRDQPSYEAADDVQRRGAKPRSTPG